MFKSVKATSIKEYIDMLEPERREAILFIDRFIKKTVPKLKPLFAYTMLGYGTFKYINAAKKEMDWPVVSLASQKNYISLYICSIENGRYLAENHKAELGKVKVGKSCIQIKKIEDLDLKGLAKVLKLAAKKPGLSKIQ